MIVFAGSAAASAKNGSKASNAWPGLGPGEGRKQSLEEPRARSRRVADSLPSR